MFISEMLGDGPSLTVICVGFLGLGLIGLGLSLFRWWASIPVIAILCLWAILLLNELYAEDLYPYYSRYPEFLYTATIAMAIGVFLPFVGMLMYIARHSNKARQRN